MSFPRVPPPAADGSNWSGSVQLRCRNSREPRFRACSPSPFRRNGVGSSGCHLRTCSVRAIARAPLRGRARVRSTSAFSSCVGTGEHPVERVRSPSLPPWGIARGRSPARGAPPDHECIRPGRPPRNSGPRRRALPEAWRRPHLVPLGGSGPDYHSPGRVHRPDHLRSGRPARPRQPLPCTPSGAGSWCGRSTDMVTQRATSDEGAGPGAGVTDVLGWVSTRLAETLLRPPPDTAADEDDDADEVDDEGWGADAASYAPAYWHWLHLGQLHDLEHPEEKASRRLPSDGPLLSIVVPVYRPSLWYFQECVQSVIDQTYRNWELCLCDDGSGDPELTRGHARVRRRDHRIKALALEENGGISRATNRALAEASGEFVVLIDHDDLLEPDGARRDRRGRPVGRRRRRRLLRRGQARRGRPPLPCRTSSRTGIPTSCSPIPTSATSRPSAASCSTGIGGFRSEFDGSQDFDVMLRATERGPPGRPRARGPLPLADGGRIGRRRSRRQAVGPRGQPPGARGTPSPAGVSTGAVEHGAVPRRLPRAPRRSRAHRR